ncbi:MAG: rhodanese-like domain-containing protein [Persephonella sp.]|nr:MAG: rhodanese-like domain-containing protein [Persephonella sp.]RUM61158.1 MAG: rhodanese-like domain-containing protein [Persephonella sp.]
MFVLYFLYIKGYIFANFERISPEEAYKWLNKDKNVVVLDVRTYEEYKNDGHIKGAILIPLNQLKDKIDELKQYKDKKIIVYCRSGNRSVMASRILSNLGFKVFNMDGGIIAWKEKGLPIEK